MCVIILVMLAHPVMTFTFIRQKTTTRAEDNMADNSPSMRAQPEDEYYYCHNIRGNTIKLLPTDSIATSVQQKY